MTLKEAAHALKLPALSREWEMLPLAGCAIDSRKVREGDLFVCLKGEKADGHDYALAAQQRGAAAVIAEKCVPGLAIPVLRVADSIRSLGTLANYWRSKFLGTVIAVTGTAGKTTLKDILATLLSGKGKAQGSTRNNNNQIGLPCSMLNLDGDDDFWVLEAGISHSGDMDDLGAIIQPDIAVIINAGPGHNEGLADKGVAWHKARILNYVKKDGAALISSDYADLAAQASAYRLRKLTFSVSDNADFRIVASNWQAGEYKLDARGRIINIKIPFTGEHFAEIAGLAAACALQCGLGQEDLEKGFSRITLPDGRFKKIEKGNWAIYDDSYNANPLSMQKMLQSAAQLADKEHRPLFLVLGEMKELGETAAGYHEQLGSLLVNLNAVKIFWKGAFLSDLKRGYEMANGKAEIIPFETENDLLKHFSKKEQKNGGIILFKGSRANRLENSLNTFVESLQAVN